MMKHRTLVLLTALSMLPVLLWITVLPKTVLPTLFAGFTVEEKRHQRDIGDTVFVDNSVANKLNSKIKVFCWITTREKELNNKIPAINETWARRCDNRMYVMTTNKQYPWKQIVNLNIKDGREHLTEKTIAALKYIYINYLEKYDWFLKADDDTYVIMENLKYLLSHYDPTQGVYVGHLFKMYSSSGYMSGGAGYVLSKQAVRLLVEKGYNKNSTCKKAGTDEDVELGSCLYKVGVPVHNSLDRFGKETFHPFSADQYLTGSLPELLPKWDRHPTKKGDGCCSQLTISFHYVNPKTMRTLDFLLYKTNVYGRKVEAGQFSDFFQIGVVPPLPPDKRT